MTDAPPPEDSRLYPHRPIVSVGAVVIDDTGRVLLVKRGRPPLMGEWSLPGGAVEVGETLVAAVQREVFEETGLVVDVGPIVEVLDRIYPDATGRVEYHYVLIDHVCSVIAGHLVPQSDADDARWVRRDDLPVFGLSAPTRDVIDKAFGMSANPS